MQLGVIGLGRMGANIVRRLMRAGHECVVNDVNGSAVDALSREGATGVPTPPRRAAFITLTSAPAAACGAWTKASA